jgi:hypothetical protein
MTDTKAREIEPTLRRCGYCAEWHSKPCDEGCRLSPTDPTFAALDAARTPHADLVERARQAADEIAALDKTLPWGDRMEFIILAALTSSRAAPAPVPEGWRIVPIEPTEEMISAWREVFSPWPYENDAWKALLAATPAPPSSEGKP